MREIPISGGKHRRCELGDVVIGGGNPVVVQSMITEETLNVAASVEQIIAMHRANSKIAY